LIIKTATSWIKQTRHKKRIKRIILS
jgi:hypothetical protein